MSEHLLHHVIVERTRCCGYGLCAAICPEIYKLDDGGIVFVDAGAIPADLLDGAREGAAACPAEALRVAPVAA